MAKVKVVGVTDTVAAFAPVPVSVVVLTPLLVLPFTVKFAGKDTVDNGRNVTVMVQLAPASRLLPQVFVWL